MTLSGNTTATVTKITNLVENRNCSMLANDPKLTVGTCNEQEAF